MKLTNILTFCCCCMIIILTCTHRVNGQAMGFESESGSFAFTGGVPNSRDINELTHVTFTKQGKSANLKKGDLLDVAPPYPKADLNSPHVRPTFEIIDPTLFPVEFVSDPIKFDKPDQACTLNTKLKKHFDQMYHGLSNSFINQYYLDRGMSLEVNGGAQVQAIDQALQITYSFPVEKAMLSLRTIISFLNQKQNIPVMEPRWAKKSDVSLMNQMLTFLDMDVTTKQLPDNVKFFLFFIFQYFASGSMAACKLNGYGKLISGLILLRTNMHEYVVYGGGNSVRTILSGQPQLITNAYTSFTQKFNANGENRLKLSICKREADGKAIFSEFYYNNRKFPFTVEEYLQELFKPNMGSDLFSRNGKHFDDAFGRFGLLVGGKPTVVYELRSLDGFKYSSNSQLLMKDQARKIPTYFHLMREILAKTKYNEIDYGVKVCNAQGQLVAFNDAAVLPVVTRDQLLAEQQAQQQQQQQPVNKLREATRELRQEVRDERNVRRNSASSPTTGPVAAKLTRSNSSTSKNTLNYSNSEENLSELRAEKRLLRVRKRIDRERRRKFEQDSNKNGANEGSVNREKLRLSREKKRLAREEARDLSEGVQPVSDQEVYQIVHKQQDKKKPKPHVVESTSGGLRHKIYHKRNGDVEIHLNINYNM